MNTFLTSNEPLWRCTRTIFQGVCGVTVAQLPQVLGLYHLDPVWSATIVALTMAVLSPIMAMLGSDSEQSMTVDPQSGNEIRKTDNGLKDTDIESPQVNRVLTTDEVAEIIEKAGGDNGNA